LASIPPEVPPEQRASDQWSTFAVFAAAPADGRTAFLAAVANVGPNDWPDVDSGRVGDTY
jgi:hypothetical protein